MLGPPWWAALDGVSFVKDLAMGFGGVLRGDTLSFAQVCASSRRSSMEGEGGGEAGTSCCGKFSSSNSSCKEEASASDTGGGCGLATRASPSVAGGSLHQASGTVAVAAAPSHGP